MGVNIRLFLLILIIIIIQVILMNNFDTLYSSLPFLDGVPITTSFNLENQFLLYWYMPVVAMSFYFTGYFSEELKTYGKILITRNYSKTKWIIKRYMSMTVLLFIFISFQIVVFYIFLSDSYITLNTGESIKLAIMYFLFLLTIFSIQLLLELYLSPQISQLIVNAYIISSLLLTKQLFISIKTWKFIYYFFLPNYAMGFKTNITNISEFQSKIIHYPTAFLILSFLMSSILLFTIFKVKKMDIL